MSLRSRLAPALALAAVSAGIAGLAPFVYSFGSWNSGMGPRLLTAWALLALVAAAALSAGARLVRAAFPGPRPDGFWPLAFVTGITLFALANGACGWLGLLGTAWFILLPVGMLAWGFSTVVAELAELQLAEAPWRVQLSWLEVLALAFGVLCLALLGLQTVNPANVSFDAAWYHLRGAERYALAGGQVRTPEGDMLLTLPQTATWLYSWAFLWPMVTVDERVRLALMLELATVLGTLALIPALVRKLCPSLPAEVTRFAWVAFFFFPSIFIYDTGLMGGADHAVALWAVSASLGWLLAREAHGFGGWALFGVQLAGLLAKYSSLYVLIPLAVLVGADWCWRLATTGPRSAVARYGPLLTVGVALALSSPYWLRNAIWYHNPMYPAASSIFPSTPWNEDAEAWKANYKESTYFGENGSLGHKARVSLAALVTHQTNLNTWGDMTGGQPIVGATYFLSFLALPFIRDRKRRLLLLALAVSTGIIIWFNTHQHHARYLSVLMPLMAAGAAAVALSLWRHRSLAGRAAVLVVVGWHVAAFGDTPFRKTHRMAGGESTLGVANDHLGRSPTRSTLLAMWESVGAELPPRALPLVHGVCPHLGLGRQSVTDVPALQFGINYGRWGSVTAVLDRLRSMGVTHLIIDGVGERADSVSGEALFLGLASQLREAKTVHGYRIGELPDKATEPGEGIVYVGCGNAFASGLYTLEALAVPIPPWFHPWPQPPPIARAESDWRALLPRATYVALESDCNLGEPGFPFIFMNPQVGIPRKLRHYVRTAGKAEGWGSP